MDIAIVTMVVSLTAFVGWKIIAAIVTTLTLKKNPTYVAGVYLRHQLKIRGVDPTRVDQDFLASIAGKNVLKAQRLDGSVHKNALCDLLQQDAARYAPRIVSHQQAGYS
jgi:hypothetical protein